MVSMVSMGLFLIFAASCGRQSSPNSGNFISEPSFTATELVDEESKARSGDDQAAQTLSAYYSSIDDIDKSQYWLKIAADRGNCHAIALLLEDVKPNSENTKECKSEKARLENLGRSFKCQIITLPIFDCDH